MSLRTLLSSRYSANPVILDDLHTRPNYPEQPIGASYVWLAYSIFFFIQPLFVPSLRLWLETVAVYAIFLAIYTGYVRTCQRRFRLLMIAAMFLLGVGSLRFNPGGSCFLVFVAAMTPFSFPTFRVMLPLMLFEEAALAGLWQLLLRPRLQVDYIVAGFFILVVGISNTFVAKGKVVDLRLKRAQEENVRLAASAERERIARDLHDVLGHTLSLIAIKAELAGRLLDRDPARAAREILDVQTTARNALAEVREAITGYRGKGLAEELLRARATLDAASVALHCEGTPPATLDPTAETALALALREAVTNLVRHSEATVCHVAFLERAGSMQLLITDDGSGVRASEGNGLRGMRERVEALGGSVHVGPAHVGPAEGTGTSVRVELPPHPHTQLLPSIREAGEPAVRLAPQLRTANLTPQEVPQ